MAIRPYRDLMIGMTIQIGISTNGEWKPRSRSRRHPSAANGNSCLSSDSDVLQGEWLNLLYL